MSSALPLVSVIVITYNQRSFIESTLDSIVNQTYPNFEVVVADDASTDGTSDIVRHYGRTYPNVVRPILATRNGGIAVNSNRALVDCQGEFIATLGGDDLMYPDKLSRQIELMKEYPDCLLCYHLLHDLDVGTGAVFGISGSRGPVAVPASTLVENNPPASSIMIRRTGRELYRFDERLPVANDRLFAFQNAYPSTVRRLEEVLGAHRWHDHNVSRLSVRDDLLRAMDIIEDDHPELSYFVLRARSQINFHEAELRIWNQQRLQAFKYLIMSLAYDRFNVTSWKLLLASPVVNRPFIRAVRSLGRRVGRSIGSAHR